MAVARFFVANIPQGSFCFPSKKSNSLDTAIGIYGHLDMGINLAFYILELEVMLLVET